MPEGLINIAPQLVTAGYWGVAILGLLCIVSLAAFRQQNYPAMVSVVLVVVLSLGALWLNGSATSAADKVKQESDAKQEKALSELRSQLANAQSSTGQMQSQLSSLSKRLLEQIRQVRGAASNTSDAPRCSSVAYAAATELININQELAALAGKP